jgi:hypothetical protein
MASAQTARAVSSNSGDERPAASTVDPGVSAALPASDALLEDTPADADDDDDDSGSIDKSSDPEADVLAVEEPFAEEEADVEEEVDLEEEAEVEGRAVLPLLSLLLVCVGDGTDADDPLPAWGFDDGDEDEEDEEPVLDGIGVDVGAEVDVAVGVVVGAVVRTSQIVSRNSTVVICWPSTVTRHSGSAAACWKLEITFGQLRPMHTTDCCAVVG